jgi:hypothetical protein
VTNLAGQGEDFEGCAKKLESAQGHAGRFFVAMRLGEDLGKSQK